MNLREAASQALQALVETQQSRAFTQGVPDAINALRAALAEANPMQCEHCGIKFADKQPGSTCPKCYRQVTKAEAPNPWKAAVHDAFVINWAFTAEHENDPRQAVADLIAAEVRIALDPLVSSEAQALIDRGKAESAGAEPVTDAIGFVLYARGWETEREDIEHFSDAMLAKIVHGWRKSMPDALTAEHSGDCTKQPWTCIRCSFERIHSDANRIARAVLAAARGKG